MRSKWLDWTPEIGSVGFEGPRSEVFPTTQTSEVTETPVPALSSDEPTAKTAQGEPTKPTEPSSGVRGGRLLERPSDYWGSHGDAYGWRMHLAQDAIRRTPAPEGLIAWLGEQSPILHRKLTVVLMNRISRAWDDRVSFEDFDALCFELVDTFRCAAELYRATAEARKE
jgi:hypothetical protein